MQLTITTVVNATATYTLNTSDEADARAFVQQIPKAGGVFDDQGVFYLSTAILKVAIR
jgi:hypothetical protein